MTLSDDDQCENNCDQMVSCSRAISLIAIRDRLVGCEEHENSYHHGLFNERVSANVAFRVPSMARKGILRYWLITTSTKT
jgi:hypothetical protein